jgi:hypothetical protein
MASKPKKKLEQLHTSSGEQKASLKYKHVAQEFLSPLLPVGWQSYFDIRKAGKWWGLSLVCPTCGETPPSKLLGSRRWRWLAVHIAKHKPVRLAK